MKNRISIYVLTSWFALLLVAQVVGQQQAEDVTASISDVAWIAGQWHGEALGAKFEETWNAPVGGSMVGMFKLYNDSKAAGSNVKFYELLTIVEVEETLVLRLKHFGADLAGWEEKEKSVEFPLVKVTDDEAIFDGLKFRRLNDYRMDIEVILGTKDGKAKKEVFRCHRVGAVNKSDPVSEIKKVLEVDKVLSAQRNDASHDKPLRASIEDYVDGLSRIDFSRCPAEFNIAFLGHRKAWQDFVLSFNFKDHDSLRGEMHDLLDKIRASSPEAKSKVDSHFEEILETWGEIEVITQGPHSIDLLKFSDASLFKSVHKWRIVSSAKSVDEKMELEVGDRAESSSAILINGVTKNGAPYLFTNEEFGDARVQFEFMVPKGSNSGIYLMGRYEVQILDSFGKAGNSLTCGDLGGIYERTDPENPGRGIDGVPPAVNAALKPGQWQTLDIIFRAPEFDEDGKKLSNARFDRVKVNGQIVQKDQSLKGPTVAAQFTDEVVKGPISIQGDHGPIAIRKFIVTPLDR